MVHFLNMDNIRLVVFSLVPARILVMVCRVVPHILIPQPQAIHSAFSNLEACDGRTLLQ